MHFRKRLFTSKKSIVICLSCVICWLQVRIDLSVPRNVDPNIVHKAKKKVIDVDVLSEKTEKTLKDRKAQIPVVEEIIQKHKAEFYEWLSFRKATPAINSLKQSLESIKQEAITQHVKKNQNTDAEMLDGVTSQIINKIVSKFALHLKSDQTKTNQSIKVMKEVFDLESSEK